MRNCSSHRDSVPCGSGKRTKKILPISEDVRGKRQSKDNELADEDQPREVNRKQTESHSVVSDFETPWTIQSVHEFSRPEYWRG